MIENLEKSIPTRIPSRKGRPAPTKTLRMKTLTRKQKVKIFAGTTVHVGIVWRMHYAQGIDQKRKTEKEQIF